jgi:RNA 3'-terminal phosphate cyclase/RNA 3'-terminal phosphate cyclase (RTC), insert domain
MKRARSSSSGIGARHLNDKLAERPGAPSGSSIPAHLLAKQKKSKTPAPAPIVDHGAVTGAAKPIVPASVSGKAVGGPTGPANAAGNSNAAAGSLGQQPLKLSGSAQFRQRLVYATLARRRLRIDSIRSDSENPGLQDFEASFLRLLDKVSNGMALEINETGTALKYNPGVLQGGVIEHDCGLSRSIGWFIEGILPLLPFCKKPTSLTLTGITSDAVDIGVDALRAVALPFLSQFGLGASDDTGGLTLTIMSRGCPPLGGGKVRLTCPSVRELKSISITDEGLVRKVRGVAYCCRVAPQTSNRIASSAK